MLQQRGTEALRKTDRKIYELVNRISPPFLSSELYHQGTLNALRTGDGEVYDLITEEYKRLRNTIQLTAAGNMCSQAVLAALGSVVQNKTMEGFVGCRRHGGCEVVDAIEALAIQRAKKAFGACYANVQAHSGSQANQIVLAAILEPGDKVLSMRLEHGGHFSHGSDVSFAGRFFEVQNYGVDEKTYLLDYDAVKRQAMEFRPNLIVCGASIYTRTIDFAKFREIADEVGAYLLADISHISGLVMAGAHPSPIDYAHFATTSTYKPGGPRGGLILMGKDFEKLFEGVGVNIPLWQRIERATFPGVQGTPYLNHIAAKAVFFKEAVSQQYKQRQFKIIENARRLAGSLTAWGHDVLTGGTDNHMVLLNVSNFRQSLAGIIAQRALEQCGIVTDMVRLAYDKKSPEVGSGVRLGTPIVTKIGMGEGEMDAIGGLIDSVLKMVKITGERAYELNESYVEQTRAEVEELCLKFPNL